MHRAEEPNFTVPDFDRFVTTLFLTFINPTFVKLQDGGGSIWKVDLTLSLSMLEPSRVYRAHASSVTALVGVGGQVQ